MNTTSLSEKIFLVTGATSGIGLACAEGLVRQGATLIGVGRSAARCLAAEKRLRIAFPGCDVTYLVADLSLQTQVRALAEAVHRSLAARGTSALDGLLNVAGTFTYWLTLTPEGFEMQWAVNHLAPFLLTHELLPLLECAPAARVVTVSSESHVGARINWSDPQLRRRYNGLSAYGNTKLANILFTRELNRRLTPASTVHAFAADPGLVNTEIGLKGTPAVARWVWNMRRAGGISPEQSARGIVFLLTEPSIQDSQEIYWRHANPRQPSRHAQDIETARRLWDLSEQMCGLRQGVPS